MCRACIFILFAAPSHGADQGGYEQSYSQGGYASAPYRGIGVPEQEHVVLLHGITSNSLHLLALTDFLTEKGYDVIPIDYPSTLYPLEQLIEMVREDIQKKLAGKQGYVHFVGHSMGGLMIRGILKTYKPAKLGRVVMFGTPNHGSEFADLLKDLKPYQLFFGPAGQQLTTHNAAVEALLGLPDYPFGIIASISAFDVTLIGSMIVPGDDDGMVSVESTKLQGMDDFISIPRSEHVFQPLNEDVQNAIANYLKYGKFKGLQDYIQ